MPDQTAPIQEYFSIRQTATLTGLSTKHVTRAMKSGRLAYADMSNGTRGRATYRIHRDHIATWMKTCQPNMGPSRQAVSDLEAKYFPKRVRP